MYRRLVLAVVVLALVAGPVASVPAASVARPGVDPGDASAQNAPLPSSPDVVTPENTSSFVDIPAGDVQSSRLTQTDADVADALAIDASRARTELAIGSFTRRFETADSDAERIAATRSALEAIDVRVADLRGRQRNAIRAYNRDSIDTGAFVQTLAEIHAEAEQLTVALEEIDATVSKRSDLSLPDDVRSALSTRSQTKGELVTLRGPVRDTIQSRLTAGTPVPVYVETGTDSVVLARVSGNSYVRETYLATEHNPIGENVFRQRDGGPLTAAYQRAKSLYPWAYTNSISGGVQTYGDQIYTIVFSHKQGEVTTYIDGNTTSPFREVQTIDLTTVPTKSITVRSTGGLEMQVNGTYQSGPLSITVRDARTGSPVDATVAVGNQTVGQTGPDGHRWTVDPTGQTTVSATTSDGASVVVLLPDSY
jgi:hypothetical protein